MPNRCSCSTVHYRLAADLAMSLLRPAAVTSTGKQGKVRMLHDFYVEEHTRLEALAERLRRRNAEHLLNARLPWDVPHDFLDQASYESARFYVGVVHQENLNVLLQFVPALRPPQNFAVQVGNF